MPNPELKELIKEQDPLKNIHKYSSELTISQVIKFFERQGINTFTRTMIQNYIRVGVLPVPKDKRYYLREHMMCLILIDNFKNVYSLDEIKKMFALAEKANIKIDVVYEKFWLIYNSDFDCENENNFFYLLELMVRSVVTKNLAKIVLEKSFL